MPTKRFWSLLEEHGAKRIIFAVAKTDRGGSILTTRRLPMGKAKKQLKSQKSNEFILEATIEFRRSLPYYAHCLAEELAKELEKFYEGKYYYKAKVYGKDQNMIYLECE